MTAQGKDKAKARHICPRCQIALVPDHDSAAAKRGFSCWTCPACSALLMPVPAPQPKVTAVVDEACTTPETCGICHRCQRPEPHDCTIPLPRDLRDRLVEAMTDALKELDGKQYVADCVTDGISDDMRRLWAIRDPLRSALDDLKKLGGERG